MHDETDNPALDKSYAFALQIIDCVKSLQEKHREFTLSQQLLCSGTAIGAKVEEGVGGQAGSHFLSEMENAHGEARKTHYWLRLLHDSHFIETEQFDSLLSNCEELLRILGSICKTARNRR